MFKNCVFALTLVLVCGVFSLDAQELPNVDEAAIGATTSEEIAAEDAALVIEVRRVVSAMAGADSVSVSVNAGVVTLKGEVLEYDKREELVKAVQSLDGVIAVENELRVDLSVRKQINPIFDRLTELGQTALRYIPLLLIAGAIFFAFWLLANFLSGLQFVYVRLTNSQPLQELVRSLVRFVVLVIGIIVALDVLNATAIVGGILGAAGVAGIAVGFAFRDLIENYIASLMLSVRQPFKPNDHVLIDGHEGIVSRLTTRSTVLTTLDGNSLRLPNGQVFKSVITNYTATPNRRFDFAVGVGYDVNLEAAQKIGIEVLESIDGVIADPGPTARVEELGDSTVTIRFYAWVDQTQRVFGSVRSRALARIKTVFDEHEIDMPEPIYNLRVAQVDESPVDDAVSVTVTEADAQEQDEAEDRQFDFLHEQAATERVEAGDNMIDEKTPTE